ncbi:MAG: hypothetical protein KY461_01655 [Actinobacteria bacterium]|nr:hypothetical protein [Actinomycetota bacterium]
MPFDAARTARTLHGVVELVHTTLYFARDARDAWSGIGLEPLAQGYFAGRAAPLGAVGPEVVTAIFFNFSPTAVGFGLPAAWEAASPAEVLAARARAMEALFERVSAPGDGLAEATELAGVAAGGADLVGRPLAAANAAVPLPGTPFADLWQTLTILREHRGDGHVALLTASGLHPVEVLVAYTSWQSQLRRGFYQRTRLWDDQAWGEAEQRLRERGWLDDTGSLTDAGQRWRQTLEDDTDRLAAAPYAALGEDRSRRLFDLLRPLAAVFAEAEDVYPRPPAVPASFDA